MGKLRDEVIINSVLHGAQYDHRPCVVDCIGDEELKVRIHVEMYNAHSLTYAIRF